MAETKDADIPDGVPDWLKKNKRFKALLETHGDPGKAAAELGIEQYQAGQVPRAAETLQAAVAIAPLEALYWGNYGVVLNALGQREKAVAMFNKSLALDHDQFQVWLNLANTLMPMGHLDTAIEAFEQAARDPELAAESFTGLALIYINTRRYALAAAHFRKALDTGVENAQLHANLGSASFQAGDAATAATAYAKAADMAPEETGYQENALFLTMLAGVINGKAEAAVTAFAKPLEDDTVLISAFRRALLFLNTFGPAAATRSLVKEWLDYYPEDMEARYIGAILNGRKIAYAPHTYIAQHFDELADRYDDAFLEALQYRVPDQIHDMLANHLEESWQGDILDAGCGRGALAPVLEPFAKTLTGVDLSPRMIEYAGQRVLYDELAVGDFVAYLEEHPAKFDLVAAADALLYMGSLDRVVAAAHSALRPGGWFVFDIETFHGTTYEIQPNGRFTHAEPYIRNIVEKYFTVMESSRLNVRHEAEKPVKGAVFLLQKL